MMIGVSTQIDTVCMQIDCIDTDMQNEILLGLNSFIVSSGNYGISSTFEMYVGQSHIYSTNTNIATITTGYSRKRYYISIKFAGLKRYNSILDNLSEELLFDICAYCNTYNIQFKLTELDVCIDISCPLDNILAVCAKRSPKTDYYRLDERQAFISTIYIEKISQKKLNTAVLRSYVYDKSVKEKLQYHMTRFEMKLQSKHFNKYVFSTQAIAKALDRYYVMYFANIYDKHRVIGAYYSYSEFRKREIQRLNLDNYRLRADIGYIACFLGKMRNVCL